MSKLTLESVRVPFLQIINTGSRTNEKFQLVDYDCEVSQAATDDKYTVKRKIEIYKTSEADTSEKTFYIGVEVEGTFTDTAGNGTNRDVKNMAKEKLSPHLFSSLKMLLAAAGISFSLIPDGVLSKMDE